MEELPLSEQFHLVSWWYCGHGRDMGSAKINNNAKKLLPWEDLLERVGQKRDKQAFAQLYEHLQYSVSHLDSVFSI